MLFFLLSFVVVVVGVTRNNYPENGSLSCGDFPSLCCSLGLFFFFFLISPSPSFSFFSFTLRLKNKHQNNTNNKQQQTPPPPPPPPPPKTTTTTTTTTTTAFPPSPRILRIKNAQFSSHSHPPWLEAYSMCS